MFGRLFVRSAQLVAVSRHQFSTGSKSLSKEVKTEDLKKFKVAVLGASGGIGQPLSLLLKLQPGISHLNLYDIAHSPGVAADLSHIETIPKVKGFLGPKQLPAALKDIEIVLIPAGVPRKPGMTRDDLFDTNASIVRDLTDAVGEFCPKAMLLIVTNPVNSMVPIAAEVLKANGVYDPKRLFGVTTLDIVRANTFVTEEKNLGEDPMKCNVPVICGHSGISIVPVFSQATPPVEFPDEVRAKLCDKIQNAGTVVVEAKAGAGSATLAMAYSASEFCKTLIEGMQGQMGKVQCCFVESDETEANYFASPILLGKEGVEENLGMGKLIDFEANMVKTAMPELIKNIKRGEKFVAETYKKKEKKGKKAISDLPVGSK